MNKNKIIKSKKALIFLLNKKIKNNKKIDICWQENAKKMILEKYHENMSWNNLFLAVKHIKPKNQLEQSFYYVALSFFKKTQH